MGAPEECSHSCLFFSAGLLKLDFDDTLACVVGVKRGRRRGDLGARERVGGFPSSLFPLAWPCALIPFPFPFERLPRRLMIHK